MALGGGASVFLRWVVPAGRCPVADFFRRNRYVLFLTYPFSSSQYVGWPSTGNFSGYGYGVCSLFLAWCSRHGEDGVGGGSDVAGKACLDSALCAGTFNWRDFRCVGGRI